MLQWIFITLYTLSAILIIFGLNLLSKTMVRWGFISLVLTLIVWFITIHFQIHNIETRLDKIRDQRRMSLAHRDITYGHDTLRIHRSDIRMYFPFWGCSNEGRKQGAFLRDTTGQLLFDRVNIGQVDRFRRELRQRTHSFLLPRFEAGDLCRIQDSTGSIVFAGYNLGTCKAVPLDLDRAGEIIHRTIEGRDGFLRLLLLPYH